MICMPGHVKNNHLEVCRNFWIAQQVAILAAVRASCMQANQGNTLPCFFKIDTARLTLQLHMHIPADDWVNVCLHELAASWRGASKTAFT